MVAFAACGSSAATGTKGGAAGTSPNDTMSAMDAASDTVIGDTGSSADVATDNNTTADCPGGPGCTCTQNAECDSALCLDDASVPGGRTCAGPCTDTCPATYVCAQVSSASDLVSVCVNATGRLCSPCIKSDDCKSPGLSGTTCVDEGAAGLFCGIACGGDGACPADYICAPVKTAEGTTANQCVRKPNKVEDTFGTCPCSPEATAKKAGTTCFAAVTDGSGVVIGKCAGTRQCSDKGLSNCTALPPVAETCDGVDNDCDGITDEGSCDDGKPCTVDACDAAAGCSHKPVDGGNCDADSSVCTEGDACQSGLCAPGAAKNCDDKNACTADSCNAKTGCSHSPDNGVTCDDENPCTVGEVCQDGGCASGKPKECKSTDPCLDAKCDMTGGGACVYVNKKNGASCNDGDACTKNDGCQDGACSGTQTVCNDGNPCTDDGCDPQSGCAFVLNNLPCNDNNACTDGDTCVQGVCTPKTPSACDDQNPCTSEVCDIAGGCTATDNTAACVDGSVCTVGDVCAGGKCQPGAALGCEDGNPCTVDSCDPAKGCVTGNVTGGCNDGNACTSDDNCSGGGCVPGSQVNCDDGNVCTMDSCEPASGCVHVNSSSPCEDGNVCTTGDTCAGAACVAGAITVCNDGNVCTDDTCDAVKGCVAADNSAPCSDDSVCTEGDACQGGACVGGPAKSCDDTNGCTNDACDGKLGCLHIDNGNPCDDSNACTSGDTCKFGACASGIAKDCDDQNPCTADACDTASGQCGHKPTPGNPQSCYEGPKGTVGVGICQSGIDQCDANGQSTGCVGQVLPAALEVCNGQDDTCDGTTDEGCNATSAVLAFGFTRAWLASGGGGLRLRMGAPLTPSDASSASLPVSLHWGWPGWLSPTP